MLKRFYSHSWDVVDGYKSHTISGTLDLRFWLHKNMSARSTSLTSLGAKKCRNWAQIIHEPMTMHLLRLLSDARSTLPPLFEQPRNLGFLRFLVKNRETFRNVSAFTHDGRLANGLFAVRALAGIKTHDTGETARRVIVEFARGAH